MHLGIKTKIAFCKRFIIVNYLNLFRKNYPLEENKFFCISMIGQSYGCNIKPLSDYIEKSDKENKVVWAFSSFIYKKFSLLRNGKCVRTGTYSYYKELFTSKYVISNQRLSKDYYPIKRSGQVYMQTWHGTSLKQIEADIPNIDDAYHKRVQPDSDKIDVFISGSKFMTNIYQNSFWYSGNVYETGTPRNDVFFNNHPEIVEKVRKALNIKQDKRIILYAPTFRSNAESLSFYDIDAKLLIKAVQEKFGGNWRLLIRLHPAIHNKKNSDKIMEMYPNSIDASIYPDMQELLYVSDILITDYSSSMFDYMYSMRPCFLYVKDKDIYDRGFYMSIDELPFPKIESNKFLEDVIMHFDIKEYKEHVNSFMNRIGSVEDGHATERCFNILMNKSDFCR